jgi:ribonuclease J
VASVVALGGLGEIGRNMTVFARGPAGCRLQGAVPEEEQPGVDLILPDFLIRDRLRSGRGRRATHGHEDHIGGVPYLLREKRDLPLTGPGSPSPWSRRSCGSTASSRTR